MLQAKFAAPFASLSACAPQTVWRDGLFSCVTAVSALHHGSRQQCSNVRSPDASRMCARASLTTFRGGRLPVDACVQSFFDELPCKPVHAAGAARVDALVGLQHLQVRSSSRATVRLCSAGLPTTFA